jgi:hypothetical protein
MHMVFWLVHRPRHHNLVLWVCPARSPTPGEHRHTNQFDFTVNPSRLNNHAFLGSRLKLSFLCYAKFSRVVFS